MEKEKMGRLVLSSKARMNGTPDNWSTLVDMGNFSSNQDDMIKIEVDYITPLLMSSDGDAPINYFDSVEVMLDYIPQQYSYDNTTQTNTCHLAFLEKNVGQVQTKTYTGPNIPADRSPEDQLQIWTFTQQPSMIVVRPEVLQNKMWNIRLKFITQDEPSTVVNNFDAGSQVFQKFVDQVGDYKIILSCTK